MRARALHHRPRRGRHRALPSAPDRDPARPPSRCGCSTTAAWTAGKARSTSSSARLSCAARACRFAATSPASARTTTARANSRPGSASHVRFTGYADYDAARRSTGRRTSSSRPTYAEGFSNTILEAMASGLPVVSCHAVGVVDCLRDGENGLLVQPGDIPALAAALRRGSSRMRRSAGASPPRRWRSAAAPIPGTRWGGRSWAFTPRCAAHRPATGFDPALPRDPDCRFRAAPHLL